MEGLTAGLFFGSKILDKFAGLLQIGFIGVPFGQAADEFEGTVGIVPAAGKAAENAAVLFFCRGGDGGKVFFRAIPGAVGAEEKDLFSRGEILRGVIDNRFVKLGVIDAGGKADPIVLRQAGGQAAGNINEIDFGRFGHGFQDLEGIAMMAGIIADGGFHEGASLGVRVKGVGRARQSGKGLPAAQRRVSPEERSRARRMTSIIDLWRGGCKCCFLAEKPL